MNDKERIVRGMRRELVLECDWFYLSEVEYARIAKMVDAVITDLKTENVKLRELGVEI